MEKKIYSKKTSIFLAVAIAILIAVFILCYIKGWIFTFLIGIPLASCLSGPFFYFAFQRQVDESVEKYEKEKKKRREKELENIKNGKTDPVLIVPFFK